MPLLQVATFDDWGEIARNHFNEDGSMDFGVPCLLVFATLAYFVILQATHDLNACGRLFIVLHDFSTDRVLHSAACGCGGAARQLHACDAEGKGQIAPGSCSKKMLHDGLCSALCCAVCVMCAEVVKVGFVQVLFSIDPLLKKLLGCANQDELTRAIQNIYRRLDADRSGGLSYHELRDGLKKMDFDPPIILSEAEFDMITEGKTLCDDDEELDAQAFDNLLRLELIKFCHRQLSVSVPGELQDRQCFA